MSAPLHATTVSIAGRGVLIRGASGSGKSALALELLALGAKLVADDGVELRSRDGQLWAHCPEALEGQIEARFVGILSAEPAAPTPVVLVIEMDHIEAERLPPRRTCSLRGVELPCLHKIEGSYFAAAIMLYVKGERVG
ncbi:HPr kinase/phosphorylase [Lentibacter algarum]|uniref:HPr kinase/phosphorylase n=1 Tax=Lentibacter algarum TaxID=576131 RepID=UPI00339D540E